MTEQIWIFLIIQVIGFLAIILKNFHDRRLAKDEAESAAKNRRLELDAIHEQREQDREDREQDRLDRGQLAKLTLEQLEQVQVAGNKRLGVFVKETADLKKATMAGIRYSREAVETANNTNQKIAVTNEKIVLLGETILEDTEKIRQVEIANKSNHPVPVKEIKQSE